MILLLAGSPGSGKGTQAQLLSERLGFELFGVGEALRRRAKSDAGLKAQMDRGDLVPMSIAWEETEIFLNQHQDGKSIIDGAPRDMEQAQRFQRWTQAHPDVLVVMVELTVSEQEVKSRLKLRARDDDNPASLDHRLHIYRDQTQPVIEHLSHLFPYYAVDGEGSIEDVYQRIIKTGVVT